MNFNRNKILPAAIALALSHCAFAQHQETELEPVVVTANRVARTADETLTSVTIITRKDIEAQQARSVPELLNGLPGVQISNNGGPGKTSSLYLRGSNNDHTLVLIDGVRVGSATAGGASLQDIPVDMIERIELVRGPRASLYGADAIGGVIQIFTRKGPQKPSFSIGGGSRQTYEGSAAGGFGSANAWLNAGVSAVSTNGINVINGGSQPDPDQDGYQRSSANVRGGGHIGESFSYDAQAMFTEGHTEFDSGNSPYTDIRQDLYAGNLRYVASEQLSTSLKVSESTDASSSFSKSTTSGTDQLSSRFDTRRTGVSWQNDLTLAKGHQLVGGLDYQYDEVMTSSLYAHNKRTNRAVFGQYLADIGAADLQLAGRHDDNEQFGHHNTGSVATGYSFSPALRLRASYGTAFKAPTFNQLYYPLSYGYKGNPELKPEESRTGEIGASGKAGDFTWQTSLFKSHIDNLIDWAKIENTAITQASNVSQAKISGLELQAAQNFGNTKIAANATFLNAKDRSGGANDGNHLGRRARQSGKISADHDFGKWRLGSTLNGVGKRFDTTANTTKLGGYATIDLRAEYAVATEWRIQTRIENALDKRYETASTYNQPGFGAFVTVRYQPK